MLSILAASIAYIVFSIWALADIGSKEIEEYCKGSQLWLFSILTLILGSAIGGCSINALVKIEDIFAKICCFMIGVGGLIAFTIWGFNETYGNKCIEDKISHTKIFVVSRIQFWLMAILSGINIFLIIYSVMNILCCYCCDEKNKKEKESTNNLQYNLERSVTSGQPHTNYMSKTEEV